MNHANVRIHIDRQPFEAKEVTTGNSLYQLGNLPAGHQLFLETHGNQEDEPIPDSPVEVKLKPEQHFYSAPRLFHIFVNTRKKIVKQDFVTFEQVVALSFEPEPVPQGPNWAFTVAYRRGPHTNRKARFVQANRSPSKMARSSMSKPQIAHSPDLQRLRSEGFNIEIVSSTFLVLDDIPYVNSARQVQRGKLVSKLELQANITKKPNDHIIYFIGEYPCNADGTPIEKIRHQTAQTQLTENLVANHSFSSKPPGGYPDYYEKMTSYAKILYSQANAIDADISPMTFPIVTPEEDDDSPFNYADTASSRAGIAALSSKLKQNKVAIIGLGGTGSYVFDLLVKTPIKELHIFDGDDFIQHNAFRSPGAASIDDLKLKHKKVEYLHSKYSNMRKGIVPHVYYVDETNVHELEGFDFVFMCIDEPEPKKPIVEHLESHGIAFIDVGMGISKTDDKLEGMLRITTSTPGNRVEGRIAFQDAAANDEYAENIQIADLNMLNAALAVLKWKKLLGFYFDGEHEQHTIYFIDGNTLSNEENEAYKPDA
ncbi:MAG: DUF6791 domain-containing protein [Candidatus Obscuribacterales bacterium]